MRWNNEEITFSTLNINGFVRQPDLPLISILAVFPQWILLLNSSLSLSALNTHSSSRTDDVSLIHSAVFIKQERQNQTAQTQHDKMKQIKEKKKLNSSLILWHFLLVPV